MGVIPGEPTDVEVTEATKSYVVLAWKPPAQRGHEGVMYYIEKVRRNGILPLVELTFTSRHFDIQLMVCLFCKNAINSLFSVNIVLFSLTL